MTENENYVQGQEIDPISDTRVYVHKDVLKYLDLYQELGTIPQLRALKEERDKYFLEIQQYRAIGTVEQLNTLQQDYWKLNEICKEYSAIGTIEELQELKAFKNAYEQVRWERDIAISQLEEIGISLGQKMDDIKELKEKNEPKKMDGYDCPICRHYFKDTDAYNYCPVCGQKMKPIWQ